MSKLSRAEVLAELSSRANVDPIEAERVLQSLADLAEEESAKGFLIPNLGELSIQPGPEFEYRNPATGTTMMVPGPPSLAFTPDSGFEKNAIEKRDSDQKLETPDKSARVLPTLNLTPSSADMTSAGLDSTIKSRNKLGGQPDWIQGEPNRMACCGSDMTFYGQFDSSVGGEFNVADSGMI
ncbi:MAG TPA: hypothetical protein DDW52_28240 [Planctomycetaceae bacterium]|nr:hypothetical protein [Planctomycetaceae bacterium]